MPLDEYAHRRNFAVTPEPPARVDGTARTRFCVQRHKARRLHYDFRLEADGVLVSWAVPRGPSLDPADKRMAVHTEDHPVDYLLFEGVIPAGQYGAGSVMLWDEGTYELLDGATFAEQHARGDIKFRLHGTRLRGDFVLVRMARDDGRSWLLIKKRDAQVVHGWDIEGHARSVASNLSQEEIAQGGAGRRWTRQDGLLVDAPCEAVPARLQPPLLDGDRDEVVRAVDGRRLRLTHLNKVLFPGDGYTRRDLINFYSRVADLALPYLRDRPLTLTRYPDGIEAPYFFQKRAARTYPDWLSTRVLVTSEGEEMETIICNDAATLVFLANLGCIDQTPWLSRLDSLDTPDFLLLDLDPQGCEYDRVAEAALVLKGLLDRIGLRGFPKTSGARGLHIYVPLQPRYSFEQTRNLAHVLALLSASARPDLFTSPGTVEKREPGKVYMDHPQNRKGSTISAPYTVRPVPAARVAMPLDWSEVRPGLSPEQFTLATVFSRLERVGDLFAPVLTLRQTLEEPISRLENLI